MSEAVEAAIDDIPEPVTPSAVLASAQTNEHELDLTKLKDTVLVYVHDAMETLTDDARLLLARLSSPVQLSEEARITAVSPEGFTVTLVTRKATASELVDVTDKMIGWLAASGYTSPHTGA